MDFENVTLSDGSQTSNTWHKEWSRTGENGNRSRLEAGQDWKEGNTLLRGFCAIFFLIKIASDR